MTRFINALLVFLMVLSAAAVYDMKYEAELAAENVGKLERDIAREREAISLLKAEWSVLNQPGRLQELVERHQSVLQLTTMTGTHIGTLADIPEKPLPVPDVKAPGGKTAAPAQRSAKADAPAGSADAIR